MKYSLTLVLAFVVFCAPASAASSEKVPILVIPKGERVQYWRWMKQGALDAGRDRRVEIIYRGPRISDDYQAQLDIIQIGIDDKVDAIVLAPSHAFRAKALLEKAKHNGIVVILIDSDMEFEGRTSFVASDNFGAGQRAAKHLLSLIGHKGSVLLMRYKQDNASTAARENGFLDVFRKEAKGGEVIDSGYIGVSVGNAYHRTLEIMKEHQDVKAIFSPGEATTVGCLKALDALGLAGKIKVVGFDYTDEIHRALKEQKIHGVVLQRPYRMGYFGVMTACDALEGKPVDKRVVTDVIIATDVADIPTLTLP